MSPATCRIALLLIPLVLLALAAVAPEATACPFCDGGPDGVNEVRDGVFDENFWPRVAATVAPFPVLAGVVALIYFGPPTFRRGGRKDAEGTEPASPTSSA
jgi:hypothetical protein